MAGGWLFTPEWLTAPRFTGGFQSENFCAFAEAAHARASEASRAAFAIAPLIRCFIFFLVVVPRNSANGATVARVREGINWNFRFQLYLWAKPALRSREVWLCQIFGTVSDLGKGLASFALQIEG